MADGLNRVFLIGNLGDDPSMRYTANGKAVTTFRLAVSRTFNGKQETEWCSIVAWEKTAELVAAHLVKGRQCHVEGRLQTRNWEDKDGKKQYKTEIIATSVLFLGSGNGRKPVDGFDPDDGDYLPGHNEPVEADELPWE